MDETLIYRFAGYTLHVQRRRLVKLEQEVVLPDRAFTVLLELVANAPEVVSKQQLMDAAWPDVVVVEDNLVQAIRAIRTALGGDSKKPKFVQTVHRKGYRFVAPVTTGGAPADADPTLSKPALLVRRRRRLPVAAIALLVLVVVLGAWLHLTRREPAAHQPPIRSLAVLPLDNLSNDPEQEYFADGMTEVLITELARNPALEIISRTSIMKFKGSRPSVPEIAQTLGVDALVEGSVTRAGERVRVIAQLVDANDRHLWAENYEYDLQDILELQRTAARAIAAEIGARIGETGTDSRARRVAPQAMEAYLRARSLSSLRTEEALFRAQQLYSRAIELAPRFAPAHAGLADVYNLLANYGFLPSTESRPEARRAAEQAIVLDPKLADGHVALAIIKASYDWDFAGAEEAYQRALRLSPSSVMAHARHAQLLVSRGRLAEAVTEIRRAHRLDPLSDIVKANLGWFLFLNDQLEEAEEQLLQVLEYSPDFAVAHFYLGVMYDRLGRFPEALAYLERARELSQDSSYAVGAHIHALARSGKIGQAEAELAGLLERRRDEYVSPIGVAVAHFGLGNLDAGFAELEKAFAERKGWLLHLEVEPALDGLRSDPRYLDLVHRVGLP